MRTSESRIVCFSCPSTQRIFQESRSREDREVPTANSRITGKPQVMPADPIRAITSGWPTIRLKWSAANGTSTNSAFLCLDWSSHWKCLRPGGAVFFAHQWLDLYDTHLH